MTWLDWLLLVVFGLPLVTCAADYWGESARELAAAVRVGLGRIRSRREGRA